MDASKLCLALLAALVGGCTSLHPIRPEPNATNYKGQPANAYCPESGTCRDNLIHRYMGTKEQALHNLQVYRGFYDFLATDRRTDAALWSDLFAFSTVFGVLAVAKESSRGVRVGVFGAGLSEIMDTRYQFKKQAEEFRLATKVLGCVEDHVRDAWSADGKTAQIEGKKVVVRQNVLIQLQDGKTARMEPVAIQVTEQPKDIPIDILSVLRPAIGRINELLSTKLEALAPARPNAEEIRNAFLRQKEAIEKTEGAKEKEPGGEVKVLSGADLRALRVGAALQEHVDECISVMR